MLQVKKETSQKPGNRIGRLGLGLLLMPENGPLGYPFFSPYG